MKTQDVFVMNITKNAYSLNAASEKTRRFAKNVVGHFIIFMKPTTMNALLDAVL